MKSLADINDMRQDEEHEYRYEVYDSPSAKVWQIAEDSPTTLCTGQNQEGKWVISIFSDFSSSSIAHETRHGGQFARGEMGIDENGQICGYGVRKEVDAYRAQIGWDGFVKLYLIQTGYSFPIPQKFNKTYQINDNIVNHIATEPLSMLPLYPPSQLSLKIWLSH